MTADPFLEVRRLCEMALALEPGARATFLDEACHGDRVLQDDVERRLAAHAARPGGVEDSSPSVPPILDDDSADRTPLHLQPRSVFANRYEIQEEIGRGGFGVVYRAVDRGPLQRTIALKLIRLATAAAPEHEALARRQFLKEARTAGSLSHHNIATVFDVGEWAGTVYMTQELAPGRDLKKILAEGACLPLRRAIAITRQICDGLAHAHANGIVHRDIKPANVVIDLDDSVKITDFGLAQPAPDKESTLDNRPGGTFGYMAPEQLLAQPVDARADQFSVGCVLYEMLTGRPAFPGATLASVIEKTLHTVPQPPSRIKDDLPRALDRVVARAMRKAPDERYASINLLAQDLLHYAQFEALTDPHQAVTDLVTALEARTCLLLLGLHLPVAVGEQRAPTSDAVIAEHLSEQLGVHVERHGLARMAQDLEIERGRTEMLRALSTAVRSPSASPREVVRRVARLGFPVIVTTGYDTFLEEELARLGRPVRRVLDGRQVPDDISGADLVIRLFGTVDSDTSIVVTEDDLWEFFGTFHSLSDSLKAFLAQRTLLFVGYDPEDEGFRHLLAKIASFRAGTAGGCYLTVTDASLPAVRWSQSKGLRLVETQPAAFLRQLEEAVVAHRRAQPSPEATGASVPLPPRPYKFLNYYEGSDERIFFGRGPETSRIASKIHAYPLNLLYAPSGAGKTSLICAGLMPSLQREGYACLYARVYDDPVGEVQRASRDACRDAAAGLASDLPLPEFLPQVATRLGKRLVVFVDQCEELFIRFDRGARDRFAEVLAATLTASKGQVRFVLCLREDFLARLSEFRDRIPHIFHNEFRLDPLSEASSREAITQPAKLLGFEVEPVLVDRLIADLSREGLDPPQLQIVCDTLFDKLEPGEMRLTLKSYEALGETRKILGQYLERTLRELAPEEREPARAMLKCLVTSEHTKSVSRMSDLIRLAGQSEEEVSRVLTDLGNRRLIRRVQREEGFWYELTHEYLVEEIGRWLSEKEKELKRVRELLEQAVRNHRNLGIAMPMAQIRLVRTYEDDLHLSKEERQLLRNSEDAVRGRRKAMVIVGTVAALLVLASGVIWRYTFLHAHIFLEPQDKHLIEHSRPIQTKRMEGIRVYTGSPTRLWLDAQLGFPKLVYQTDFELDQLDASHRNAVKAGTMFKWNVSVENEILKMLSPDEAVRFLITTGQRDEALKLMPNLFKNRSVDNTHVDRLVSLLGYSGITDPNILPDAMRHGFRPATPGQTSGADHLAYLLMNFPEASWRSQVVRFLGNPVSRRTALAVLGSIGTKEDIAAVIPYLEDLAGSSGETDPSAIRVLDSLGDCTALSSIRRLVFTPRPSLLNLPQGIRYIARCGNQSDLLKFEQLLTNLAENVGSDTMSGYGFGAAIESLHAGYGRSSVPALQHVLMQWPPDPRRVAAIRTIREPELLSYLRSSLATNVVPTIRAAAAVALSESGELGALTPAAEIAVDSGLEPTTRATAIETFYWFKGPALRRFLLRLLKTLNTEDAAVHASILRALRWYDDDEALTALIDGLKDTDDLVRSTAQESLAFTGSERNGRRLEQNLDALPPEAKVYAARTLQLMQLPYDSGTFSRYVRERADTSNDYTALVEAVVGLRAFYLSQPTAAMITALRDQRREVRLAATLALAEHSEPETVVELLKHAATESNPQFQLAVHRTLWAVGVYARMRSSQVTAQQALSTGDLQRASRMFGQFVRGINTVHSTTVDYVNVLMMGLSASKPIAAQETIVILGSNSYLFDRIFTLEPIETALLRSEINLRNGFTYSALYGFNGITRLVNRLPAARKTIGADPRFAPLRGDYDFRVMTGLELPKVVSDISFPDAPVQIRKAAQN